MTAPDRTGAPAKIAVVLLNWHDEQRTLAAAERADSFRVSGPKIVVDNESTEQSWVALTEGLPSDWVVLRSALNVGYGAAHNLAFQHLELVDLTAVLLVNTDATIEPGDFALLVDAVERDPRAGVVAPVIYEHDGESEVIQSAGGRLQVWRGNVRQYRSVERLRRLDYLTFACALVRASAIGETAGFDERFFMYWEDVDLCLRIRARGYSLQLVAQARAMHELSASGGRAGPLLSTYGTWSASCFAHKRGGAWPATIRIRVLVAALLRTVRGDRDGARAGLRGLRLPYRGRIPGYELAGRLRSRPRN